AAPARDCVPTAGSVVAADRLGREAHGVVPGGDVVEGLVVAGAAADAVEGSVDEAEVTVGVLVGERDQTRPQWRARAGAAAAMDGVRAAAGAGDHRQRGVGGSGGGHVGDAPAAPEARYVVLVAGPREEAAEAATRRLEVAAGATERQAPRDLAD